MTERKPVLRAAIVGTGRIADLKDGEHIPFKEIDLPPGNVHASMYSAKPLTHGGAYQSVPGYQLVAAANRGEERLTAFGERYGVRALYTDVRKMLAEEKPDVVSVCTQSPEKCEIVLACAEAGVRAVVVEKAFATSMKEADVMLAACEKSGTFVAVAHPMRFSPMFRRLKALVDEGAIGRLGSISTHASTFVHGGTHDFDLFHYLAGPIKSLFARIPDLEAAPGDPFKATYPDKRGDALVWFESGVVGSYIGTSGAHSGFELRGSNGYVTAPRSSGLLSLVLGRKAPAADFGFTDVPGSRPVYPVTWEETAPAWPDASLADEMSSTQRMLHELHATLTHGAPFASTGRDGALALEAGIACYHSGLRGTAVSLPLEERELRVHNR